MNRYLKSSTIPQPIRKIIPASTDFYHILKRNERLDQISGFYYQDRTLAWIIMCANPQWDDELEIPVGSEILIPWPLKRVFNAWKIENSI